MQTATLGEKKNTNEDLKLNRLVFYKTYWTSQTSRGVFPTDSCHPCSKVLRKIFLA